MVFSNLAAMYKPPVRFFPSRATRRQISHTFREFLRGAGTGALARGDKVRRTWGLCTLIGVGAALLAPHLAGFVLLGATSTLAGVAAYMSVQGAAALAHRVANKRVPEAPHHNRKAQRWGKRTAAVVAVTSAIGATAFTAGFVFYTGMAGVSTSPTQQFKRHAPPRLQHVSLPVQPAVAAVAALPKLA